MSDARKRRKAKQARRDARRADARSRDALEAEREDVPLVDEIRTALAGHPVEFLELVSTVLVATEPDPFDGLDDEEQDWAGPDASDDGSPERAELIDSFIDVRIPETTALLAALAEMIVDDDVLAAKCRRAVGDRRDELPEWLADLGRTTVRRAVRMTDALGDGDEVLLDIALPDGQPMTGAAFVDHNRVSMVRDAFFVPSPIDAVLEIAERSNDDPDVTFVEMSLADAREWLRRGTVTSQLLSGEESDTWPASRALLEWLIHGLPGGGQVDRGHLDDRQTQDLYDSFFASLVGAPFDTPQGRLLLSYCVRDGTGDPLRWSDIRVRQLLDGALMVEEELTMDSHYLIPDLMRAFIPFAHARSKIRDDLTADALTAIDEEEADYLDMVRDEAAAADV